MLRRAKTYCQAFLAKHTQEDMARTRAKVALQEIRKELDKLDAAARKSVAVTIHWTIADDADVYLNGKPLRTYKPSFRSRSDEAYKTFSAKATLRAGDVITLGGRRGGSYGIVLIAVDREGRVVWQTDTKNWQAYTPAAPDRWYLPSVAAKSPKRKVTVNPSPWHRQNDFRRKFRTKAQSIWPGASSRTAYLVSVVR